MATEATDNNANAATSTGSPTGAAAPNGFFPGSIIGPYHLLQLIGEGGMGQVWMAEQRQPVRRRVALKLIKAGMDTREVVARFESERQALALMDHPAIAKVFDAGSTPEGRPYFAMEYVAGLPITLYCDQHKLTMRQRMELFVQVCEGVQHAHQKAILHRDLKPSNILVTEVDGKPVPRIIDFGVAKAMSQQLDAATLVTRVGVVVGTPGYMSLEQAGSAGEDIDTRSDVYSLGVVLYELLVGALPLDLKKLAYDELLRRLREQDVIRPSTRLRTLGAGSAASAENRDADLATLIRQLRGDADAITLKALEKDRRRRYGSPAELAADIGRYLRNEPVIAHAPTTAYRARKYIVRHRLAVALAAVAMLLLIGFTIAQAIELRTIRKERDRADRITGFMTNMFKVSNPSQSRGNDIRVREILDKASTQIVSGLAKEPQDQARLMQVMGEVYENLGLYPQAESLTRHALAIQHQALGESNRDTLKSMHTLSEILDKQSQFSEAEKLARQAVDGRTRLLGTEDHDTLLSTIGLAWVLTDEGRYADAEQMNRKTLEAARRKFGVKDTVTLKAASDLAIDLAYEGKFPESERQFRELWQMYRDNLGPDDPGTIGAEANVAAILIRENKNGDAAQVLPDLLERDRRVLGADHPNTLRDMGNLALTLRESHRYPEAEKLFRETLALKTQKLGAESRSTLVTADNLASVLRDEHKDSEAEPLLRQTVAVEERTLGKEHSDTLVSTNDLGQVLTEEGHYAEAERILKSSYDTYQRLFGLDHDDTAQAAYNLAALYAAEGRKSEAVVLLTSAIDHGLPSQSDLELGSDPMLKSLKGDPAFDLVLADARRHAGASQAAK